MATLSSRIDGTHISRGITLSEPEDPTGVCTSVGHQGIGVRLESELNSGLFLSSEGALENSFEASLDLHVFGFGKRSGEAFAFDGE